MKYTFTINTFAPATDKHEARFNERTFRAPACVTSFDGVDALTIDVQNNINYFTRTRILTDIKRANNRLEKLEVASESYDKTQDRIEKLETRLDDFESGCSFGWTFNAGFASLFTWAVIRASRRDANTDYVLNYQIELLRAIYDAESMSDADIENLRLSVVGFMRYHTRNMEKYGKAFDIRFTTAQAKEVVHFANAHRFNWSKMSITERETTDNDIIAHCILSALRKTFGWDAESTKTPRNTMKLG